MTVKNDGRADQIAGRDIINGNVINIHHDQHDPTPKLKVVINPGPEHIGDEQRAKLKALVDDIVKLESIARRTPKPHSSVWSALNKRLKTTSYHLIKANDFEKAAKFLREWIGRLSSTKSAAKNDPDWRKRKYSFIFTNVKQLDAGARLTTHLSERYGVESAKELDDTQLAALYHTVSDWKRADTAKRQAKPAVVSRRA